MDWFRQALVYIAPWCAVMTVVVLYIIVGQLDKVIKHLSLIEALMRSRNIDGL